MANSIRKIYRAPIIRLLQSTPTAAERRNTSSISVSLFYKFPLASVLRKHNRNSKYLVSLLFRITKTIFFSLCTICSHVNFFTLCAICHLICTWDLNNFVCSVQRVFNYLIRSLIIFNAIISISSYLVHSSDRSLDRFTLSLRYWNEHTTSC